MRARQHSDWENVGVASQSIWAGVLVRVEALPPEPLQILRAQRLVGEDELPQETFYERVSKPAAREEILDRFSPHLRALHEAEAPRRGYKFWERASIAATMFHAAIEDALAASFPSRPVALERDRQIARDVGIWASVRLDDLEQAELAGALGITPDAVRKAVRQTESLLGLDSA